MPSLSHGSKPTSVACRVAGEWKTLRSDGTWGVPAAPLVTLTQDHGEAADEGLAIDAELAAKIAVGSVLLGVSARDVRWLEILDGRAAAPPVMRFSEDRLSLDWPDHERDELLSLAATIRSTDAGFTYDGLGLSGPDLLEDTFGVFGEGTVLVHDHDLTGTVVVDLECASKTIRDGVRMALATAFGREPRDLRGGRRVIVEPYYDRPVRISLAEQPFSAPDGSEEAHAKRWPLMCFLDVDVPRVRLVATEPRFQVPPVPRLFVL